MWYPEVKLLLSGYPAEADVALKHSQIRWRMLRHFQAAGEEDVKGMEMHWDLTRCPDAEVAPRVAFRELCPCFSYRVAVSPGQLHQMSRAELSFPAEMGTAPLDSEKLPKDPFARYWKKNGCSVEVGGIVRPGFRQGQVLGLAPALGLPQLVRPARDSRRLFRPWSPPPFCQYCGLRSW